MSGTEFDTSVAHQARMYDYLLGGKDNYAADRAAIEAQLRIYPDLAFAARANRAFLGRVVRYLAGILARAGELLDFSEPVAVTLVAILHAIPDSDDPHGKVARLMAGAASGSYLAISHMGTGLLDSETQHGLESHSGRMMQQRLRARSREQVARFFEGMDLVPPGVVPVEEWGQEPGAGNSALWGAVGRKR